MPITYSSTSVLVGARDFNAIAMPVTTEDVGGKLAMAISTINALVSAVSALNVAVSALNAGAVSAAGSGATWSAFSATPTSSILLTSYTGTISNFRAS